MSTRRSGGSFPINREWPTTHAAGGGRRDGCRWWKRGQLSIRSCSKLEARSVRHSQPVHNGSRAFKFKRPPVPVV